MAHFWTDIEHNDIAVRETGQCFDYICGKANLA